MCDHNHSSGIETTSACLLITGRVSKEGNAIGRVRSSVFLFRISLLSQLTFDIDVLCVCDHNHSSGIESEGHTS